MKTIAIILSLLLLTSCSNPDTSGGVTLSRGGGGDWDNTFPNGSCKGPDQFDNQGSKTGCGWVHSDEGSHYITSCSNPETWDGVTLSRGCGNDSTNVFPYGSCEGPSADAPSSGRTECGWISAHGKTHYIFDVQQVLTGVPMSDSTIHKVMPDMPDIEKLGVASDRGRPPIRPCSPANPCKEGT